MARSIDRPLRYFIAKRTSRSRPDRRRPHRRDSRHLKRRKGWRTSSTRRYTRMVPAHYVADVALVGCPDPNPTYTRFFDPAPQRPARRPRRNRPRLYRRAGG